MASSFERRFQIFISSTFRDLIDERQAVLKAVLELDHMPAGMELFPAADDTAWQLIKDVIDSSDYYALIIGGRYGSLDEEGIGYTEKEYDYAVSTKKPVIPLLHANPDALARDKTEVDPEAWEKLKKFRSKVEGKHTCVYWSTVHELKAQLIVGLTANFKRHPATGWVRADQVPSEANIREVLSLRKKVSTLEAEIKRIRTEAPPGTENLMHGSDTIALKFRFTADPGTYLERKSYKAVIHPTWDDIFGGVAPILINEASEFQLRTAFRRYFEQFAEEDFEEDEELKGHRLSNFKFKEEDIDTCIIQLRALGLIRESERKRSITDTDTYWTLTPFGDRVMVQLRAVKKEPDAPRAAGEKAEKADEAEPQEGNDSSAED